MVMGRNGYGPKWSWAEMVMGRNDPESFNRLSFRLKELATTIITQVLIDCYLDGLNNWIIVIVLMLG